MYKFQMYVGSKLLDGVQDLSSSVVADKNGNVLKICSRRLTLSASPITYELRQTMVEIHRGKTESDDWILPLALHNRLP